MAVTIMSVLVVILIIRVGTTVVIWMSASMMVMIMRMKARGGHILPRMPMQPGRRCPGELKRDEEHDDQGDEAAHGPDSTDSSVFTKSSIVRIRRSWSFIGIYSQWPVSGGYTQAKGRGKPTIDAREALAVLQEQMDVLHDMLYGVDYGDFRAKAWQLLPAVANHVLGLDDGKKRFADTVLAASKAFALCCTLDDALAHRDELAFLQAVKAALTKHVGTDKKLNDEQKEHALRQIISRAVVSNEVIDIFTAAGLKRPDIGVLSDEFLEDVRHMKERNLAVELLERLLKGEIRSRFKTNVVQEAKFSEFLQQSPTRYRNRAIETAQVIEELIEMARKFQEAAQRGEVLGLNHDEMAFYDALATNEAAVRDLGDETLKKIAVELVQSLRKSVTVDWAVRETVRARLRVMVKTLLRRYKYPPDKQEEATESVLKQAESLSADWVAV